nr:MAG TPA: hypothetical protein [Caudoviricetes sp.]
MFETYILYTSFTPRSFTKEIVSYSNFYLLHLFLFIQIFKI